jgi:hypothetical protein
MSAFGDQLAALTAKESAIGCVITIEEVWLWKAA